MPRYIIPLEANTPFRAPYPGRLLQIINLGGAVAVSAAVEWGGDQQSYEELGLIEEKFKIYTADKFFSALNFVSSTNTTLDVMISPHDMTFNPSEGANVTASLDTSQFPLPVEFLATPSVNVIGTPNFTLAGVGNVNVTAMPAVSIAGTPTVSISGTPAVTFSGAPTVTVAPAASSARLASSAASTNATLVKASAGTLKGLMALNTTAATVWLKLYDKATAPTVGTDAPTLTLPIPAGGGLAFDQAMTFAVGIGFALTTGVADADTGAVASGAVLGLNICYS